MAHRFFAMLLVALALPAFAQDDLMNLLDAAQGPVKKSPVAATFKGTRIVNLQTNELPASGVGQLIISHRFGTIVDRPLYNFGGLDVAQMRLEYSYSPAHWLNVGLGRSSANKTYDGFAKVRFLRQKEGGMPVSVVYYHSTNLNTTDFNDGVPQRYFTDRLAYAHQLILARKHSEALSLELAPTVVHYNLVATPADPNDQYGVGLGGRYKLTDRMALTAEYFARFHRPAGFYDPLSVGLDLETGGHVFQFHISNARFMNDPSWMMQTPGSWGKGELYFGFNLSRVFTHRAPKMAKEIDVL
jgi:hypothetical protein